MRRLLTCAIAIASAAALTGCSVVNDLTASPSSAIFSSADDARAATGSMPQLSFLPDEADTVRMVWGEHGALAMVAPAADLDACEPTEEPPAPAYDDTWWPELGPGVEESAADRDEDAPEVSECDGGWYAFDSGDATYAYRVGR